ENCKWAYNLIIDGKPNPTVYGAGNNLNIEGWTLSYPAKRALSLQGSFTGSAPSIPISNSIVAIRVEVLDQTGGIVPSSEVINRRSYSTSITSTSPVPVEDLVITDSWLYKSINTEKLSPAAKVMAGDGEGVYEPVAIIGNVENKDGHIYKNVRIMYLLYNPANQQVGTASDTIEIIEPYQTWSFKAPIAPDKSVASIKLGNFSYNKQE
ncbi:MAG: FxLYD domain-containing protein, partial [Methanomicrobiales archaeon]|nr:FxLYD domain-containing protein [Methanomicrobiales archaeon]